MRLFSFILLSINFFLSHIVKGFSCTFDSEEFKCGNLQNLHETRWAFTAEQ